MILNKNNRYFHVTLKQNMGSILANGLIAQIGERSKEIGESQEAVYLFPNREEMETALANWLGECFEDDDDLVILQIDLPEDFPVYREIDSNGNDFYEAYCTCDIPKDYITAIYNEEYDKEIIMNKINSFSGDYDFLSNFYNCPVTYDGITYTNSEAAYQAQKCTDKADRLQFVGLHAGKSKRLGRRIALRPDWEDIKVTEMLNIVRAKFSQNDDLKVKLLATGDSQLEEGNTWGDTTWGTVNGQGANLLGKILMQVRTELHP